MKMNKIAALALVAILSLGATGCTKVPAGNVGVKVYLLGGSKGVDTEELSPGRYWIGINEELFLFPTFAQNYTWTYQWVDENEDGKKQTSELTDESIPFQTKEGLVVSADVGISYNVDPTKVSILYQKYRKGIEEITDGYLRNMVRDALVNAASVRPVETVYGEGKAELLKEVEATVRGQVSQYGILVEKLYWAGEFRLPTSVVDSINAKITATQKTQQRENEIAQSKAEADKAIEDARGVAESVLLKAKADAESLDIKGAALRRNPEVLKLTEIEAWKFGGAKVPTVMGAGQTFFNLSTVESK